MAQFTVTIQELMNNGFDFGLTSEDYPIFEERWRGERRDGQWEYIRSGSEFIGLNRKILDHFYYREIGQETPDMFRMVLNRTMREIMPYYNELYLTQKFINDPFETLRMETRSNSKSDSESSATEKGSTKGNQTADSKSRAVVSQFPQTMINNTGDYATSGTDTLGETSSSNESDAESAENASSATVAEMLSSVSGSAGSRAGLLSEYRASLINVDLMVLAELEHLFMFVEMKLENYYNEGGSGYGTAY